MKKTMYCLFTFIFSMATTMQAQNLLSGRFTKEEVGRLLISQSKWQPFPKLTDRTAWAKADQKMMKDYAKEAENYIHYSWPSLPATTSLLIVRTGNRSEYDQLRFKKRQILATLLLGEIYENKGRFIDPIINGVYSICEETFWGSPAHLPKGKEYSGLMDVTQPFVELFGAETATYLAFVDYYLGDRLDSISPQIRKRIYYEVNNRIFQPVMSKPHGWMASNANGRRPNNWNPWICSNWLNTALLLEKDDNRRTDMVYRILNVLDQFLNPYPQDGGCDEGPGYWNAASASLFDNIDMLNEATKNSFQYVYEDEKVKNMGRFIYRAQISEKYFLDFADASPQPGMDGDMIYRFGKAIEDTDMMKFGAFYRRPETARVGHMFFRNFYSLFLQNELQQAETGLPLPQNVWLPDLEVMIARDQEKTTRGWFIAAKGGNNDESHNHNDIGNYIVYYDGYPLLIDVGSGTYTARTFGSHRYDIWFNHSDYHNVPAINGVAQGAGANFKASRVASRSEKSFSQFSLDIASSYPENAGVSSWQRTVRLNRGKSVAISDKFSLIKADSVAQHIMTCYPAEVIKPGEMIIHYQPEGLAGKDFVIKYNAKQLQPVVEKVAMTQEEDKGILQKWGDSIYRITFKVIAPKKQDKIDFLITTK